MFKSNASFQSSMFGSFAYEKILERHHDHLLMRMARTIDFSFIHPLVEDCYSELGRKAYDPVCMVKLLVLQTLYDCSEREVVEQADTNLLFRTFLERSLDDDIPHWTLLGKFRERLGEERFTNLFNRLVVLAKEAGLLDEKLRIIDSTAVRAKVDVARHLGSADDDNNETPNRLDRRSPDPDARIGHKSTNKQWYGYKVHVSVDPSSDIVTAVATTSANEADVRQLVPLLDQERALFTAKIRNEVRGLFQQGNNAQKWNGFSLKERRTTTLADRAIGRAGKIISNRSLYFSQ